jgi:predicted site-specific integrase-resolvase
MSTIQIINRLAELPSVCVDETKLIERLGISRKTLYCWRLQGMPCYLLTVSHLRYFYVLDEVMYWGKFMRKKFANCDTW